MRYADRKRIEEMWLEEKSVKEIAEAVGAHRASVYKELQRGETGEYDRNQRREYSADLAQRRFHESMKNRGRRKGAAAP